MPAPPQPNEPNCMDCPFAIAGKPPHQPILGKVPTNPAGLIVVEGPSREDVEERQILSGSTGRQFTLELLGARLNRDTLAVVPAAACYPPPTLQRTEAAYHRAVLCCQPLFWSQLQDISSDTPVLALGRWAHFALTGKHKKVMSSRGFIRPFQLSNPTRPLPKT